MSASQTLGGVSRAGRLLGPSLDKIIKNAAWRKHSHLVSACKSALDKLDSLSDSPLNDPNSPIVGFLFPDAESVLAPSSSPSTPPTPRSSSPPSNAPSSSSPSVSSAGRSTPPPPSSSSSSSSTPSASAVASATRRSSSPSSRLCSPPLDRR
ncbi:hypothetical protein RchiOBHm_Chr6g0281231 [Rosa chinensis]|uniref:Uncharacterized protein n=1 Tax=Rosa chinensis TaxID=74649 RepID=A0A2P6PTH0_ROSCH|nr:hypothetical protein RchiOBHm_Chr6g0281231 [Rosa chinensis]